MMVNTQSTFSSSCVAMLLKEYMLLGYLLYWQAVVDTAIFEITRSVLTTFLALKIIDGLHRKVILLSCVSSSYSLV